MTGHTVSTDSAAEHVTRYLDHLTVERGAAANTVSSYRRDLGRYADYLGARGIDSLAEVT
ncbi:site-specific integrase, partial [Streptomyces sp. SID10244]|nr:site-specific integrase [Streptomyces sp. SID10244]